MSDATLPEGEDKRRAVRSLFDTVARRYDLVNAVMTFGMDTGWRRRAVDELRLPGGAPVLDLACGTGDFCNELRRKGYRAIGIDFSHGMLTSAITDSPLVEGDVLRLPIRDAAVDGATCGFALRNVVDLGELFRETARVVRSGGRVAFLETGEPDHPLLRAGHRVYFRKIVPVIGGALSDRAAYRYLPRSAAYLPPVADMMTVLSGAGFADVRRIPLSGGLTQLLVGTRR